MVKLLLHQKAATYFLIIATVCYNFSPPNLSETLLKIRLRFTASTIQSILYLNCASLSEMWSCSADGHFCALAGPGSFLPISWYVWTSLTHKGKQIYYFPSITTKICLTSPLWSLKCVSSCSSTTNWMMDKHQYGTIPCHLTPPQ